MKLLTIHGFIDRRILVNFTANPDVVSKIIPAPFRLKVYKGKAIVGICLIRLRGIKPKGFPSFMGIGSENGAHRIAVEWDEDGITKEGVYIPRRDTSLRFNALVGGKLFPGKHYLAGFDVKEGDEPIILPSPVPMLLLSLLMQKKLTNFPLLPSLKH